MGIVCPYFLKKQHLKLSSAAKYRWRFMKRFLAIRRVRSSFYFVEKRTRDPSHIQEIHIDQPSMYPCTQVRMFKSFFPYCM